MFASWSGGEYGSVGATEWLEVRLALPMSTDIKRLYSMLFVCIQAHLSSLSMKAFSYINLDGVVAGISTGFLIRTLGLLSSCSK